MTKQNQAGFSVFEACIITLVVVLLLLSAWFIWGKNKDNDYEKTANGALQTVSKDEVVKNATAADQTYLTIKEWNVRFKTTTINEDAYYTIEAGKPNYAYLSVHSLTNPECAPDKTSVGVITRFKQGDRDPNSDELYTDLVPDATKVGNYYYFFSHAQAYCDESKEATLKAVAEAFEESVKTAEATQ